MYGDFSRILDAHSEFSAVLAQQGRLLLDAELNEQSAIVLDYLRRLATDLIGPFAGPSYDYGFDVKAIFEADSFRAIELSGGAYYVYGLRIMTPERRQDHAIEIGEHEVPFIVYLLVWEQSVSAIQYPELAEPALGPNVRDTSRRRQVRWRPLGTRGLDSGADGGGSDGSEGTDSSEGSSSAGASGEGETGGGGELTAGSSEQILQAFAKHNAAARRGPLLGARAHPSSLPEQTPSTVAEEGAYRGVENQLYRVEVHRGGEAEGSTFKWSRDNGSVEFELDYLGEGADGVRTAGLRHVWTDARLGLQVGDWVEFVDDSWMPFGTPAPLMRVQSIALAERQISLWDSVSDRVFDKRLHPLLRRWDQRPEDPAANHGIPLGHAERKWYELEDGVQVRFEAHGARYTSGDYWLIPARTSPPGVLWPRSHDEDRAPLALAPSGPTRYLAPLALVKTSEETVDLRVVFRHRMESEEQAESSPTSARLESTTAVKLTPVLPPFKLRSVSSFLPDEVFAVGEGATAGRAATNTIHLPHPDVSREHARFGVSGGQLTVEDLKSTNGTWINLADRPIPPNVATPVAPDDLLTLGTTEVQFTVEKPA